MNIIREPSFGAALMAVLALGVLGVALTQEWFEYDATSGRQTAPDGPYNEGEDGIEREHLTVWADRYEGSIEPDQEVAYRLTTWMPIAIYVAAGALALVALGEIPGLHYIVPRRVSMALSLAALGIAATAATMAFIWLPDALAPHLANSQFTARLDEPRGYTETNLAWGWYAMALTIGPALAAAIFKFQAGTVDLAIVERAMGEKSA